MSSWYDDILTNRGTVNDAVTSLKGTKNAWDQTYAQSNALLNSYLQSMQNKYGDSYANQQKYLGKLENLGAWSPSEQFSYNTDISTFMDPSVELRKNAAMDSITNSQANAGNMFSSDYLNALNAKSQAMASDEYDRANSRMQTDRTNKLAEYNTNIANEKAGYQSLSDLYNDLAKSHGKDSSTMDEVLGDYISNLINSKQAATEGKTNLSTSEANIRAQQKPMIEGVSDLMGIIGSVAKFFV
jgi:hypothetical protein